MIAKVLNRKNMHYACKQVVANKGVAGVDGMGVDQLPQYLEENGERIATAVCKEEYQPQAILGVRIPKDNGKTRLLGVPTVTDRVLQQAVHQVIAPSFELEFKPYSYGFRPQRNAQEAVRQSQHYINAGYQHIVDIDLASFFDGVEHCLLLQLLYRKVKCSLTLRLIRKWLRAPIQVGGQLTRRRKGVPQGSPLSPLLSNIMLHELDKEMEKQGLLYVRYADDFSIYTKSRQAAKKAGNHIFLFLKKKLRLPINREKSGLRKAVNFEILGYKFVPVYKKGVKGQYQLTVSDKSWLKLKQKLKETTRKTAPKSLTERITKLKEIYQGWLNYFRMGSITGKLQVLDDWLRSRLRYCIWHDWKRVERKRKNLVRLGVASDKAYQWSRTRKGGWAVAQSPILRTTITEQGLRKRGYEAMLEYYKRIAQQWNEPLYTRPVRTVV